MKPKLSSTFDSDLALVSAEDFDWIIINDINGFPPDEQQEIIDRLDLWDTGSLLQIRDEVDLFLKERSLSRLRLSLNLILDHCRGEEGPELFKALSIMLMANWIIKAREQSLIPPFEGEIKGFGEG